MKFSELKAAFFYARKDIIKDKKVFFFITAAIIFATANIIVVNGFMGGIADDLIDNSIETSVGHLNVYPRDDDRFIEGIGFKEQKLASMKDLVAFSSRLYAGGTLSLRDITTTVNIIAVDVENERKITKLLEKLDTGSTLEPNDRDILISYRLAEDMKADVGDHVTLVFENGDSKLYKIKGIIHTGIYELDVDTIFISKTELNQHLGFGDKASIILVKLTDKDMAEAKKQVFIDELGVSKVKTWVEEIEHIVKSMGAWSEFSNMVISVGLIASAISVGVIIFINVVHKRRQIGIMKAIGASNSFVFIVFIIEAGLFAILGVAGGDFLGYYATKYFETHPFWEPITRTWFRARFYPYLLYNASIVSFGITIIAGIYPALKARKTNIIKAIWG
ncbi:MAG: ABC transporter permease [Candidatus Methanoperedens nitroreducens]|uniref:ABC transporter permease n=1 Tax=Candidatus Methanoperedens nitratireducens TaxID=1392998 RepID=A0A0P8A3H9_9EURY|nr:FtsX-like permease family protein [Candidatus Methanoperedens sp. BLZ2]KAB2947704.1 MAG: ABC transporter permease [Candidatus Methanoperedens sp.]KPQ42711.1 MAG: ABC transporter permease [Candidatus Methanoperedens sp. BLZ1]MBZ0176234.1 FtsX-like permease family protein [Candidatus Methanoperedens nitroreducens]CAG1004929.1 ABC transporter permease YtrF [Methanosarcinales archaeon]MCX9026634.1 FtsX-like permease family protein [Candidatus Methanoperedens sp.]